MPVTKHEPEYIDIDGHGLCEVIVVPKVSSPVEHKHYVPESFVHPAKMSVMLCREIIRRYTEKGDVVLDPMAGIGTTLSEAVLLGRNAVGVELEGKFVKLSKKNIRLLEKLRTPSPKGKAVVIKGDSRELSRILGGKADVAVFSPPYAESIYHLRNKPPRFWERLAETTGRKAWLEPNGTTRKTQRAKDEGYKKKNNIGNLKYGKPVDAVVTSPPYVSTIPFQDTEFMKRTSSDITERVRKGETRGHYATPEARARAFEKTERGKIEDPNNIGNLRYGKPVDVVVTSPPFADAEHHYKHGLKVLGKNFRGRKAWEEKERVQSELENIGRLKYGKPVDAIVTSPPYKTANEGGGLNKNPPKTFRGVLKKHSFKLSEDPRNVDNLPYGKGVDAVITSPPFERTISKRGREEPRERVANRLRKAGFSEEYIKRYFTGNPSDNKMKGMGVADAYSTNPKNIGNLPHGKVDVVISSPPYSESMSKRRKGYTTHPELSKTRHMGLGSSDENIGNLRHGKIDAVISSPPYSGSEVGKGIRQKRWEKIKSRKGFKGRKEWKNGTPCHYSDDPENIGNLPHGKVDSIVTSPPYSKSIHPTGEDPAKVKRKMEERMLERKKQGLVTGGVPDTCNVMLTQGYGKNPDNIGNLPHNKAPEGKETYLGAMLQVYRECLKTLKPGGKMVLVLKDFVRNKKVVRLDLNTKKLVEGCGFMWVETKLFRLPSKSFWRTLYEKKYPEVDTSLLRFEFIEVFEKPVEACA